MMILNKFWTSGIFIIVFFFTLSPAVQAGEIVGNEITVNTLDQEEDLYEIIAEGEVHIQRDDLELWGDYARYHSENEDIEIEDNVILEDGDYRITGSRLKGSLKVKKFVVTGKGRITGPDDFELLAEIIDYEHNSGMMVAEGQPEFKYGDIFAIAEKISYDREQELVILSGNVEGKRGQREFSARKLTVDLAADEINMSGGARITFPEEND